MEATVEVAMAEDSVAEADWGDSEVAMGVATVADLEVAMAETRWRR